jgi:hypothetical protein
MENPNQKRAREDRSKDNKVRGRDEESAEERRETRGGRRGGSSAYSRRLARESPAPSETFVRRRSSGSCYKTTKRFYAKQH